SDGQCAAALGESREAVGQPPTADDAEAEHLQQRAAFNLDCHLKPLRLPLFLDLSPSIVAEPETAPCRCATARGGDRVLGGIGQFISRGPCWPQPQLERTN